MSGLFTKGATTLELHHCQVFYCFSLTLCANFIYLFFQFQGMWERTITIGSAGKTFR